jgi:hypothetical protein
MGYDKLKAVFLFLPSLFFAPASRLNVLPTRGSCPSAPPQPVYPSSGSQKERNEKSRCPRESNGFLIETAAHIPRAARVIFPEGGGD